MWNSRKVPLHLIQDKKNRLDNAKMAYDQRVEHAHQTMNDSVERANREYEDVLLRSV
jgi:hypothetical protein